MNLLSILTTAVSLLPTLQGGIKSIASLLPANYVSPVAFITIAGHRYTVSAVFTKVS
jgi:hypothetical protein